MARSTKSIPTRRELNRETAAAETRRAKRKKRKTRLLMRECLDIATTMGVAEEVADLPSVLELMDEVMSRALAMFRFAADQADQVPVDEFWFTKRDAQGNTVYEPNKWVQMETAFRQELFEMAARMQGLNIDDRRQRVAEAQLELLGRALAAAAKAAGLDANQQKELGAALRNELQSGVIDGTASVPEPSRQRSASISPPARAA